MKHIFNKMICLFVLAVLISACGAGPHAIPRGGGNAYTYVNNVEPRQNGAWFVWMEADTSNTFCTFDKNLADTAKKYADDHIFVHVIYSTINAGDSDGDNSVGGGCGKEEHATVLRIESIEPSAMSKKTMTSEAKTLAPQ